MSSSDCEQLNESIPKPDVEIVTPVSVGDVSSEAERVDIKIEEQILRIPVDSEGDSKECEPASSAIVSVNSPFSDDSGHASETNQESAEVNHCTVTSTCEQFSNSSTNQSVELSTALLLENVDSGIDNTDSQDSKTDEQLSGQPKEEVTVDGPKDSQSTIAEVILVNTGTDDHQESEDVQNYSDSIISDTQLLQDRDAVENITGGVDEAASANSVAVVVSTDSDQKSSSKDDDHGNQNGAKAKSGKEATREEKKEEKKKSKKKEDKSVEYILRALNSLQSPEEKLAALCKKYADLHEEHRVLQNSFKTQQRTLTVVAREKDQLQSEHTKAMIAKSKLESLCRELQKHNKLIKDESIKRAKEDDEKRKEISAQFNVTIGEIQNQMSDNSEKNNRLRKENDNLAEQLRTFISQCQGREEHVKKLQEHHDLEKKLAAAKLAQADAILKEVEERGNKERELLLFKLTEITKKSQITESQLSLYKSKYDEFNDLHTRSNETFQKYKTEMDKMTKRIKKLEKDGLQWKAKWESSSKALVEQYEARTKSELETTVCLQKMKRLESLCRALQAELHGKKVVQEIDDGKGAAKTSDLLEGDKPPSDVPVNSPEASSSNQCSPDTTEQVPSTETPTDCSPEPCTSASPKSFSDPSFVSPFEPADKVVIEEDQVCPEQECTANSHSTDSSSLTIKRKDVASPQTPSTSSESHPEGEAEQNNTEVSDS